MFDHSVHPPIPQALFRQQPVGCLDIILGLETSWETPGSTHWLKPWEGPEVTSELVEGTLRLTTALILKPGVYILAVQRERYSEYLITILVEDI